MRRRHAAARRIARPRPRRRPAPKAMPQWQRPRRKRHAPARAIGTPERKRKRRFVGERSASDKPQRGNAEARALTGEGACRTPYAASRLSVREGAAGAAKLLTLSCCVSVAFQRVAGRPLLLCISRFLP